MEVRLDASDGHAIPENTYISVRIGASHKQARFVQSRTHAFPAEVCQENFGRIEIFQRVGALSVNLGRQNEENRDIQIPCDIPGYTTIPFRISVKRDLVQSPHPEEKQKRRDLRIKAANQYLSETHFQQDLVDLVRDIIRDRPDSPHEVLSNSLLRKSKNSMMRSCQSSPVFNGPKIGIPETPKDKKAPLPPIDVSSLSPSAKKSMGQDLTEECHHEKATPVVDNAVGLRILVEGASGLRAADLSGSSDPFVQCVLLKGTEKPRTMFQTKVKKKTLKPEWNEEHLVDRCEAGDTLSFHVYDEDFGKKPDQLGHASLKFEDFSLCGWSGNLSLNDTGKNNKGAYLKLKIEVFPIPTSPQQDKRKIRVKIHGARCLRAADIGGKSDPYVICERRASTSEPVKMFQTLVKKQNLSPRWEEEHVIPSCSSGDTLYFQVLDEDVGKHADHLGHASLRYEEFHKCGWSGELTLQGSGKHYKEAYLKVSVEDISIVNLASSAKVFNQQPDAQEKAIKDSAAVAKSHMTGSEIKGSSKAEATTETLGQAEQQTGQRKQSSRLRVTIDSARGIRAADISGKSDPFVVCELQGETGGSMKMFKTNVKKKTLIPQWGEEHIIEKCSCGDSLKFLVFDEDFGKKPDNLGHGMLKFTDFHPDGWTGELRLEDAGKKQEAYLKLKIEILPNKVQVTEIQEKSADPAANVGAGLSTPAGASAHASAGATRDKPADTQDTKLDSGAAKQKPNPEGKPQQIQAAPETSSKAKPSDAVNETTLQEITVEGQTSEHKTQQRDKPADTQDTMLDSGAAQQKPNPEGRPGDITAKLSEPTDAREPASNKEGEPVKLRVTIDCAKGIRAADWNGKSDPFVVCERHSESGKLEKMFKTQVKKKTLAPVWGEEHIIEKYFKGDSLKFHVLDEDVGKKPDNLGHTTLAFKDIYPSGWSGERILEEAGKGKGACLRVKVDVLPNQDGHHDMEQVTVAHVPTQEVKASHKESIPEGHQTATTSAEPRTPEKCTENPPEKIEAAPETSSKAKPSLNDATLQETAAISKSNPPHAEREGSPGEVAPTPQTSQEVVVSPEAKVADGRKTAALSEATTPENTSKAMPSYLEQPPAVQVQVMIQSARALRPADINGKSDPFVVCELHGATGKSVKMFQTQTKKKTLTPDWGEEHIIGRCVEGDTLYFQVYDEDFGKKPDKLGHASLKFSDFCKAGWSGELKLQDTGSKKKASDSFLTLSVKVLSHSATCESSAAVERLVDAHKAASHHPVETKDCSQHMAKAPDDVPQCKDGKEQSIPKSQDKVAIDPMPASTKDASHHPVETKDSSQLMAKAPDDVPQCKDGKEQSIPKSQDKVAIDPMPASTSAGGADRGNVAAVTVKMIIESARDLRAADFNGKSDPFVVCERKDQSGKLHKLFQTNVKKKTLSPEWNEEHVVKGLGRGEALKFHVYDEDFGKKPDNLGHAFLSFEDIYTGGWKGELKLLDTGNKKKEAFLKLRAEILPQA